jgi:hypothetical protein
MMSDRIFETAEQQLSASSFDYFDFYESSSSLLHMATLRQRFHSCASVACLFRRASNRKSRPIAIWSGTPRGLSVLLLPFQCVPATGIALNRVFSRTNRRRDQGQGGSRKGSRE